MFNSNNLNSVLPRYFNFNGHDCKLSTYLRRIFSKFRLRFKQIQASKEYVLLYSLPYDHVPTLPVFEVPQFSTHFSFFQNRDRFIRF